MKNLVLNNNVYDILKWIQIALMPALATFVQGVFETWGLPFGSQIAFTINAIATLLGACLLKSNSNYKQEKDEEAEYITLESEEEAEANSEDVEG